MDDVTATQAASLLGLSERTIRRRIAAGQLPARRVAPNRFAIKVQDLPLQRSYADLAAHLEALERRVAALELRQQALLMVRPTAPAAVATPMALAPAAAPVAAESEASLGQLHALLAELARETERLAPLLGTTEAAGANTASAESDTGTSGRESLRPMRRGGGRQRA